MAKQAEELRDLLHRIDRRGYPAYKDTRGQYQFPGYIVSIDHVQGDPFAAPSSVSIHVKGGQAGFPQTLYDTRWKRIALQDEILRQFAREVGKFSFQAGGSGKSGLLSVSRCGQEVLERSSCGLDQKSGDLILRLEVGFPANGRTINSRELEKILFQYLPQCVRCSLLYKAYEPDRLQKIADLAEDQQEIRVQLRKRGLAAFVANGAVLPRESGISARPMKNGIPFRSPESLQVTLELPHHGPLAGMGIRRGITLIVGGGYHGKSTLLKALELGVYPHRAGDGREYVITDETALKIRAEDGRSVRDVDISMFINGLPNGKDTQSFSTEDASGSTSQAANVMEGLEAGTKVLLIDEDTSATNFMIRDELMQRVVHRDVEPITPFIDRVEELSLNQGISTILVAGSSGSYFHKADCIIQMKQYEPIEITQLAKDEAKAFPIPTEQLPPCQLPDFMRCFTQSKSFRNADRIKIKTMGRDGISINRETIDLRYVEQLVDTEQLNTLGYLVKYAQLHLFDGKKTLQQVVEQMTELLESQGLPGVVDGNYLPSGLAQVRSQEMYACLNRYRDGQQRTDFPGEDRSGGQRHSQGQKGYGRNRDRR